MVNMMGQGENEDKLKMVGLVGEPDDGHWMQIREGIQKKNVPFSSLLLLRGPGAPPPLSSPVGN